MKLFYSLICFSPILFACNSDKLDEDNIITIENKDNFEGEINISNQLDLSFFASYTASIGWADIYECEIKSVNQGAYQDTIFLLRIFPGQEGEINGSHSARFKHTKNDTIHRTFQGFIDSENRNWELILFDDKARL